jgi:hypothetical protein
MILNKEYFAPNWEQHVMGPSSGRSAFDDFENKPEEIQGIDGALHALVSANMLPHSNYDHDAFIKFCDGVRITFDIPWTGISPRMRRMIYAINVIRQPRNVVCAGVFCGYTFICNAGASIGSGACYNSENLVGIEILPKEAARASDNVEKFAVGKGKNIVCADAVEWLTYSCPFEIDLLYIDAKSIDFDPKYPSQALAHNQSEYFKIIQRAMPHLRRGSLILAHNSVNASVAINDYLSFVRSENFQHSMNLVIDDAGLEVSIF